MNLTFDEGKLFYDLYAALLSFVNRKLKVSSETVLRSREYTSTPPEARVAIRDALFDHRELIDEFVKENPAKLAADDLAIVATWKHAVVGKFYVFRYLTKYTIFLSSGGSPNKAYGVLGLADPLEEVIGPYLPRLITTVCCRSRARSSTTVWCPGTTSPSAAASRGCSTRSTSRRRRRLESSRPCRLRARSQAR